MNRIVTDEATLRSAVAQAVGPLADRVIALEAELAASKAELDAWFKDEAKFYGLPFDILEGRKSSVVNLGDRIRALETELVDWQRMRNEAMAVAMANRDRIRALEAAILELSPKCQGELGCPGYKLSYDLGLCPPRATLETKGDAG